MAGVDMERVLQLQGEKHTATLLQLSIQQAYSEQLEKQIASLQDRVRELEGESVGMVDRTGGEEAFGYPDRESVTL